VWGAFKPAIRKPTRLRLYKEVVAIFSSGTYIVLVFHDTTAALYAHHQSHEEPIHVPFDKLGEHILSNERCKLVLESGEQEIFKAIEKNPLYGDASDMFNKEKFADVKFCFNVQIGGKQITKHLQAHKALLAERSEVFNSRFSNEWSGSEINIEYWGYEAYHAFLFYMYSGRIVTASLNLYQMVELYDLSEHYLDPYLKSKCLKHLSIKLEAVDSFEEILDAYECAEGHKEARGAIVDRIPKMITVDNCVQVAQFANDIKAHGLLKDVGSFIFVNRGLIMDKIDMRELDSDLSYSFIKAVLSA